MLKLSEKQSLDYSAWLSKIKYGLVRRGFTQKHFALMIGVHPKNLSEYLSGKVTPPLSFYFVAEDFLLSHSKFLF